METQMTELEVLHWLAVISMAKQGNQEMENYLQAENKIRQEKNRPSVEMELMMIAEEEELTNEVEKAKQRLRKQG